MVNTLHVDVAPLPGWDATSAGKFKTRWEGFWGAMENNFSANVHIEEYRFYNVPPAPGNMGDPAVVLPGGPRGTGPVISELPNQVSIAVTFQVSQRRHWGRIFLGGLVSGINVDGRIDPSTCDGIGTLAANMVTGLKTDSLGPVIFNRKTWTALPINAVSVDDIWDIQRRRRFGLPVHRYQSAPL